MTDAAVDQWWAGQHPGIMGGIDQKDGQHPGIMVGIDQKDASVSDEVQSS